MLKEKLVTNNQYQEIVKKEADLYWKKVFATPEDQKENLEQLKKQYWQEMDNALNQYKISKFNPGLKNEALNKFIEIYCNSNEVTADYTRYKGHIGNNYISIKGCKNIVNTGYSQYLTCQNDLTMIEYCEGDLTVTTYNNAEAYLNQLLKAEEFYKNN